MNISGLPLNNSSIEYSHKSRTSAKRYNQSEADSFNIELEDEPSNARLNKPVDLKSELVKDYEYKLERKLIGCNVVHKHNMKDDDVDQMSDSEITDAFGNVEINHLSKNLVKNFMYCVNLIYKNCSQNEMNSKENDDLEDKLEDELLFDE